MTIVLNQTIEICDKIFANCDIDYNDLVNLNIDIDFFEDYNNIRVVNSFLFNFSKLQDKIGSKLFKEVLYHLKEIDTKNIPMIDILNILEKLEIIDKNDWDTLREVRNLLAHEYPFSQEERIENINIAIQSYEKLKSIYKSIKYAIK